MPRSLGRAAGPTEDARVEGGDRPGLGRGMPGVWAGPIRIARFRQASRWAITLQTGEPQERFRVARFFNRERFSWPNETDQEAPKRRQQDRLHSDDDQDRDDWTDIDST